MLLNKAEKLLMNNPLRAAVQRYYEARRLRDMGGAMAGGHALEIGCGRGVGVEIILEQFGADRVDGFDLDADMVVRAEDRLERFGDRVRLWTGDPAIDLLVAHGYLRPLRPGLRPARGPRAGQLYEVHPTLAAPPANPSGGVAKPLESH